MIDRGGAYLRTSQESSDEARQRSTIESWLTRTGRVLNRDDWFFDPGWKRHQATVRPAFNKMLELAHTGKISWIVVEEATRWGSSDAYEFTSHMGALVASGVEVYEARSGRLLNPPATEMGDYILATVGALNSTQETTNLATRSLKAKLLKAQLGAWSGGPIPYGLAVQARTAAGNPLWTVEEMGSKYEQVYPSGQVKYLDYFPKDRERKVGESLYLIPSRHQDRIILVQLIFKWFTGEAISTGQIATRLNELGKRNATGGLWRWSLVQSILENPAHTGVWSYGKVSRARHATQTRGAEYELVKVPVHAKKAQETWITVQLFDPLVPLEQWQEARARLAVPNHKAPSTVGFWLAGLVYCGHCGARMHGSSGCGSKPTDQIILTCGNYHKNITKSGCRPNYIDHEILVGLVRKHLVELGQDFRDLTLKNLYQKKAVVRKRWVELREAIDKILYDGLTVLYHYEQEGKTRIFSIGAVDEDGIQIEDRQVRIPGCCAADVEELLDQVEAARLSGDKARLITLRARHAKLYDCFVDATPLLRKKILAETLEIEAEIARLECGMHAVGTELKNLFKGFSEVSVDIARAKGAMDDPNPRKRAEAVKRVIERIEVFYEVQTFPSGYTKARPSKVRVIPLVGVPVDHLLGTPRHPGCSAGRTVIRGNCHLFEPACTSFAIVGNPRLPL